MSVDDYEAIREEKGTGTKTRNLQDMKIAGFSRQRLLRQSGAESYEIYSRMGEMNHVRHKQMRTKNLYVLHLKLKYFFLVKISDTAVFQKKTV